MIKILKSQKILLIALGIVIIVVSLIGILYFSTSQPPLPPFSLQEEIINYYANSFPGGNQLSFNFKFLPLGIKYPESSEKTQPAGFVYLALNEGKSQDETIDIEKMRSLGNQLASKEGFEKVQGILLLAAAAFEERDYKAYLSLSQKAFDAVGKEVEKGKFPVEASDGFLAVTATAISHAAMFNNQDDMALQWIEQALSYPNNSNQFGAALLRGQYKIFNKKFTESKEYYDKLFGLEIVHFKGLRIPALIGYGSVCLIEKDIKCAKEKSEKIKKLDAERIDSFIFRGSVAAITGDHKQARGLFDKALKKNPNSALASYIWGLIEEDSGNLDKAEEFYKKALALSLNDTSLFPRNVEALSQGAEAGIERLAFKFGASQNLFEKMVNFLGVKNVFAEKVKGTGGKEVDWKGGVGNGLVGCTGSCTFPDLSGLNLPPGLYTWPAGSGIGWFATGWDFTFDFAIDGLKMNFNFNFGGLSFTGDTLDLGIYLGADPSKGTADLESVLTAEVSGTAEGPIDYYFWWDCPYNPLDPDDPDYNPDYDHNNINQTEADCGTLPSSVAPGACKENSNGFKCNAVSDENPKFPSDGHFHTYDSRAVAKVIVERGGYGPLAAYAGLWVLDELACKPALQFTETNQPVTLEASGGWGEVPVALGIYYPPSPCPICSTPPAEMRILAANARIYDKTWSEVGGAPADEPSPVHIPVDMDFTYTLGADGFLTTSNWTVTRPVIGSPFPGATPLSLSSSHILDSEGDIYNVIMFDWNLLTRKSLSDAFDVEPVDIFIEHVLGADGKVYRRNLSSGPAWIEPSGSYGGLESFPGGSPVSINHAIGFGYHILGSNGRIYDLNWNEISNPPASKTSFPGGKPIDINSRYILGSDGKLYNSTTWKEIAGSVPGPPGAYSWEALNGNPDSGIGTVFQTQYSKNGDYNITLSDGSATSYACKIHVGPINLPPVADATVSKNKDPDEADLPLPTSITVTPGDTVYFFSSKDSDDLDEKASYDPDGYIDKYEWDFGDGAKKNQDDTNHSYSTSGDYTATLTVTDDDGKKNTDSVTVVVIKPPLTVSCKADPSSTNINEKVTWEAEASGGDGPPYYNYQWSGEEPGEAFNPGIVGTSCGPLGNKKVKCRYQQSGRYEATITVDDDATITSDTCKVNISVSTPTWIEVPPT